MEKATILFKGEKRTVWLEKAAKPKMKTGEPITITNRNTGKTMSGAWRTANGNKIFVGSGGEKHIAPKHLGKKDSSKSGVKDSKPKTVEWDISPKKEAKDKLKELQETNKNNAKELAAKKESTAKIKEELAGAQKEVAENQAQKDKIKSLEKKVKVAKKEAKKLESNLDSKPKIDKQKKESAFNSRGTLKDKTADKKTSIKEVKIEYGSGAEAQVGDKVKLRTKTGGTDGEVYETSASGKTFRLKDEWGNKDEKWRNVSDYKNAKVTRTGNIPTMDTFKQLAKESKDVDDFMSKVRAIKGVPQNVANEFSSKYGRDEKGFKVDMKGAAKKFMEEHGGKAADKKPLIEDKKPTKSLRTIEDLNADMKTASPSKKQAMLDGIREQVQSGKLDKEALETGKKFLAKHDKKVITEKQANPDKFKKPAHEKTKQYKEIEAKNPKGNVVIDTAHKMSQVEQSKMSDKDKKSFKSAMSIIGDEMSFEKEDPNHTWGSGALYYDAEEKKSIRNKNKWVEKHGLDKGKEMTPEAIRDGLSNGVLGEYIEQGSLDKIQDVFSKMVDKYYQAPNPNQTRLFKGGIYVKIA